MAPRPRAAPIAARPATPAPMTRTFAGGTLPAARDPRDHVHGQGRDAPLPQRSEQLLVLGGEDEGDQGPALAQALDLVGSFAGARRAHLQHDVGREGLVPSDDAGSGCFVGAVREARAVASAVLEEHLEAELDVARDGCGGGRHTALSRVRLRGDSDLQGGPWWGVGRSRRRGDAGPRRPAPASWPGKETRPARQLQPLAAEEHEGPKGRLRSGSSEGARGASSSGPRSGSRSAPRGLEWRP